MTRSEQPTELLAPLDTRVLIGPDAPTRTMRALDPRTLRRIVRTTRRAARSERREERVAALLFVLAAVLLALALAW